MSVRDQIIVLKCAYNATVVGPSSSSIPYPSNPLSLFLLLVTHPQRNRERERSKEVKETIGNHPRRRGGQKYRARCYLVYVRQGDRKEKQTQVSFSLYTWRVLLQGEERW